MYQPVSRQLTAKGLDCHLTIEILVLCEHEPDGSSVHVENTIMRARCGGLHLEGDSGSEVQDQPWAL